MGCVLYEMCVLKPPFLGKDLERLFKKVCMGLYEPISERYSSDLHNMVSRLLKVRSFDRPTCAEILQMREVKERLLLHKEEGKGSLLSTITVPKNLKDLKIRLPSANYDSEVPKPLITLYQAPS